jgi:hypothetical protein
MMSARATGQSLCCTGQTAQLATRSIAQIVKVFGMEMVRSKILQNSPQQSSATLLEQILQTSVRHAICKIATPLGVGGRVSLFGRSLGRPSVPRRNFSSLPKNLTYPGWGLGPLIL